MKIHTLVLFILTIVMILTGSSYSQAENKINAQAFRNRRLNNLMSDNSPGSRLTESGIAGFKSPAGYAPFRANIKTTDFHPGPQPANLFNQSAGSFSYSGPVKFVSAAAPFLLAGLQTAENASPQESELDINRRALIAGALFIPTMLTGNKLSKTEKPFNTILFNGHKLTAVGNLALINYTVYQKNKISSLKPEELAATILMNICFFSTVATGGMQSINRPMPQWVNKVHKTTPWLTIVSSGVLLYLLGR